MCSNYHAICNGLRKYIASTGVPCVLKMRESD